MLVDIVCPACTQGIIKIDPHLLAQGAAFCCLSCGAKMSVSSKDQSLLQKKVNKYEEYKQELRDNQAKGNKPEIH